MCLGSLSRRALHGDDGDGKSLPPSSAPFGGKLADSFGVGRIARPLRRTPGIELGHAVREAEDGRTPLRPAYLPYPPVRRTKHDPRTADVVPDLEIFPE